MTKAHRMFELVREQSVGTQSICFFCAGKGIIPTTFHYWKRKYDDLHAPTSDGFIDIAAHYQGAPQPIDIIYPNGVELDSSCYDNWNSYEIKLIRRFFDDNTHKYTVGELLDEDLITESTYTRRKMVYSHFTKQELLNQKKAED